MRGVPDPPQLPPGNWRLDPFTRVQRFVPNDPDATQPDAFDETPEPKRRTPNPREPKPIPHGTPAGNRMHYRRGQQPCTDCWRAENERRDKYDTQRYLEGDPRYTCACGARKARSARHCRPCADRIRWSPVEIARRAAA